MKLQDDQIIRLTTKENPHRVGSKDFKKWSVLNASKKPHPKGISVADAVAKGAERSYVRYAVDRGLLEIVPAKAAKKTAKNAKGVK